MRGQHALSGDRTLTRRQLVGLGGIALSGIAGTRQEAKPAPARFPLPGPFRGRVVEVFHPESTAGNRVNREAIGQMISHGMRELTGDRDEITAWRRFFTPGDTVGIKVCLVGRPHAISQPETVREIIDRLNRCGIENDRIVVFTRYEEEFEGARFENLPSGVRRIGSSPGYSDWQVDLKGYDPRVFVEFPRVMTDHDPENPQHRRSYLSLVASQMVNKIINVAALKDHGSAGITMALKNLSHGCVNNVCRTHASASQNWCDTFIPAIVAMPELRKKVVLHIGDGLIGMCEGGPGAGRHSRTWEYRSLFFATDPVAMDRIGWQILDEKRVREGLPKLAETGRLLTNPGHENFDRRQPEHVILAAKAGLGEADLRRIDRRRVTLGGRPG